MPEPRKLSEEEWNGLRAGVLAEIEKIPNLTPEGKQQLVRPMMMEAIAKAENSPAPPPEQTVGHLLGQWWKNANPLQALPLAKTMLGAMVPGSDDQKQAIELMRGVLNQSYGAGTAAWDAAQQGNYGEAFRQGVAAVPLVGAPMVEAGDQFASGDYMGGAGSALGLLTPFGVKYGTEAARVGKGARAARLAAQAPATTTLGRLAQAGTGVASDVATALVPTPAKVAAAPELSLNVGRLLGPFTQKRAEDTQWAHDQGLDLDLWTATGNPMLHVVQQVADESLLGSRVAQPARERSAASFTRKADEMTGRISPTPTSLRESGEGTIGRVLKKEHEAQGMADVEYQTARDAAEQHRETVDLSARELDNLYGRRNRRMIEELGGMPTKEELSELRRIREELENGGFEQGGWVEESRDPQTGQIIPGHRTPGSANVDVYRDILDNAPGTAKMTNADMAASITTALETGEFGNAARGALEVARHRLNAPGRVGRPFLPPGAGDYRLDIPEQVEMPLPMNMTATQRAFKPIYDEWVKRPGFVKEQAGPAFDAISQIVHGPEWRPALEVERLLGPLKNILREGGTTAVEGTRGLREGVAALAVKVLERDVQRIAGKAPEVLSAVMRGRAATTGKGAIVDIREQLQGITKGGQEAQNLVARLSDKGAAGLLAKVQEVSPDSIPHIARAKLQELMEIAGKTDDPLGGAAAAKRQWEAMSKETKQILFGREAAEWDHFWRLAERRGQMANPSRTMTSGVKLAEGIALGAPFVGGPWPFGSLIAPIVSKAANSPGLVRLLTQGFKIPVNSQAGQAAWVSRLQEFADKANKQQPQEGR